MFGDRIDLRKNAGEDFLARTEAITSPLTCGQSHAAPPCPDVIRLQTAASAPAGFKGRRQKAEGGPSSEAVLRRVEGRKPEGRSQRSEVRVRNSTQRRGGRREPQRLENRNSPAGGSIVS